MTTISNFLRRSFIAAALAGALCLAGCSNTAPREVTEQDSKTTMGLDIQNFNGAAKELTNQMLTAPRMAEELTKAARANRDQRPLVKISRIRNDTGLKINMVDYLVAPIEEVFVNSGKVDFFSEDKLGGDVSAAHAMMGRGGQPRLPDFVLHGVVSRLSTATGNTGQNAYVFQMRVTNAVDNSVIFVGSKQLIKQAGRGAVGF